MSTPENQTQQAKLLPGFVLFTASLVGALVFASAFSGAPEVQETEADDHTPATEDHTHAGDHGDDAEELTEPELVFFAGGLWSQNPQFSAFAESALLTAHPQGRIIAHELGWDGEQLIVRTVSPRTPIVGRNDDRLTLAVLSIDHAGQNPTPEFANALQEHLTQFEGTPRILIFGPLPGPDDARENRIRPYSWGFLDLYAGTRIIDFTRFEPQADIPGVEHSGYLKAWLASVVEGFPKYEEGSLNLSFTVSSNSSDVAQGYWTLNTLDPYQAVPAMQRMVDSNPSAVDHALLLHRAIGVAADRHIAAAMASDDPNLRALAARALGDLHDISQNPIGRLTVLAEDKDMRVRYEALIACDQIGGRRAAGVAQLIPSNPMDEQMQATYQQVMAHLLTYGEPIQADSRIDRLRRMPFDELLAQERDALVCTALLERTELPDAMIDELLTQFAQARETAKLPAFTQLLSAMNPATLEIRQPLLDKLVAWDPAEVREHADAVLNLTVPARLETLRLHAAGAIANAFEPAAAAETLGLSPLLFKGLALIENAQQRAAYAALVTAQAFGDASEDGPALDTRIAAIDAIELLPADRIRPRVQDLYGIATTADKVGLRFAAIRAINALPPSLKELVPDIDAITLTSLTLRAVPGQMRYDLSTLTVTAGRPAEITLINPDSMEHNLVITTPGQATTVGMTISGMSPEASRAIGYIPDSDAVLYHTRMLRPGETQTLRFVAPTVPGTYEYVCTYPNHYTSMRGTLEVIEP